MAPPGASRRMPRPPRCANRSRRAAAEPPRHAPRSNRAPPCRRRRPRPRPSRPSAAWECRAAPWASATCRSARFLRDFRRSSQRKKVRSADMLRASERPANLGPAARRHEGPEALGIEPAEIGHAGGMAQLAPEPAEELAQVALVGLERLVGASALVREVGEPRLDRLAQVAGPAAARRRPEFPSGSRWRMASFEQNASATSLRRLNRR